MVFTPDNRDDHDHAEELATLLRWRRIDYFGQRDGDLQLAHDEMTVMQAVV